MLVGVEISSRGFTQTYIYIYLYIYIHIYMYVYMYGEWINIPRKQKGRRAEGNKEIHKYPLSVSLPRIGVRDGGVHAYIPQPAVHKAHHH